MRLLIYETRSLNSRSEELTRNHEPFEVHHHYQKQMHGKVAGALRVRMMLTLWKWMRTGLVGV